MFVAALLCLALPAMVVGMPCKVDTFPVQQNFDLNKYLGKWYIWQRYVPGSTNIEDSFENHQHSYIQDGTGEVDVFVRGRNSGQCEYPHNKIHPHGANPAKLHYHDHDTPSHDNDYWVISTDYDNYAVVYGCLDVMTNGKCARAYSYILVRSVRAGVPDESVINSTITSVCLDRQNYDTVPRNKTECLQCDMETWTVQPAFDDQQFMGLWYEIMFRPRVPFPLEFAYTEYNHSYSMETDGTIKAVISGRDPQTDGYFSWPDRVTLLKTPVPGKLKIAEPLTDPDDYWVIETDYTGYAFVLGCGRGTQQPAGTCVGTRSYVWSRKKYIDSFQLFRFVKLFRQYCINEDDYFHTFQNIDIDCSTSGNQP